MPQIYWLTSQSELAKAHLICKIYTKFVIIMPTVYARLIMHATANRIHGLET
jgi:hypothetical protein